MPYVQQRLTLTDRDIMPNPFPDTVKGPLYAIPCNHGMVLSRAWTQGEDLLGFLGLDEMKRLRSFLEMTIPEVESVLEGESETAFQPSFGWAAPPKKKGAKVAPGTLGGVLK